MLAYTLQYIGVFCLSDYISHFSAKISHSLILIQRSLCACQNMVPAIVDRSICRQIYDKMREYIVRTF